ncbi:MAG: hypothetical protein ACJ746_06940 [Bryobacteraceae bacterium]
MLADVRRRNRATGRYNACCLATGGNDLPDGLGRPELYVGDGKDVTVAIGARGRLDGAVWH